MTAPETAPIILATMEERGTVHRIEEDLRADWVAEWAHQGVAAIEQYLAKHLAFQLYLEDAASA